MSLLQPLSNLPISSKSQMFLIDLLIELFENPHGHIYLHHPDIQKLYEYILPRLNEDVAACAHCAYDKLRSPLSNDLLQQRTYAIRIGFVKNSFSYPSEGS